MLEELTNDIHQSPNKQKVLMELANCIASGKVCNGVDVLLSVFSRTHSTYFNYQYTCTMLIYQILCKF